MGDLKTRIDVTETVVKLLAKRRPERCRAALDLLFAKALDERADALKNQKAGRNHDETIGRVIQTAALLDRDLAQSYIKKSVNAGEDQPDSTQNHEYDSRFSLAHLRIANDLIDRDTGLAVLAATESLKAGVGPDTFVFMARLRKKDSVKANSFFSAALRSTQLRKGSDVNELLLLYAFFFSPTRIPNVTAQGIGVFSIAGYSEHVGPSPIDNILANQYLEISTRLLLDASRYLPENINKLVNGPVGDFYFLSIIEPAINEHLRHRAFSIAQQRNVLGNYLHGVVKPDAFAIVERWNGMPKATDVVGHGNKTSVDYLASQAERATNPKVKDQLFFRAALMAASNGEDKIALDLVAKLAPEYSEKARQLVKFKLALQMLGQGKLEEAELLAQRDELLVRRSYVLTLIANSLVKDNLKDQVRAGHLLDEVKQLAQKLNQPNERLAVMIGAAEVFTDFDQGQAFDLLRDVIKAGNKSETFTGELSVSHSLFIGGFLFDFALYEEEFKFYDLLRKLGARDFYQTIQTAKDIRNPAVRIQATVEACKAALA